MLQQVGVTPAVLSGHNFLSLWIPDPVLPCISKRLALSHCVTLNCVENYVKATRVCGVLKHLHVNFMTKLLPLIISVGTHIVVTDGVQTMHSYTYSYAYIQTLVNTNTAQLPSVFYDLVQLWMGWICSHKSSHFLHRFTILLFVSLTHSNFTVFCNTNLLIKLSECSLRDIK